MKTLGPLWYFELALSRLLIINWLFASYGYFAHRYVLPIHVDGLLS